jgi:hypothetical protein
METLNVLIATIVTIGYFVFATKLITSFLKKFTEPINQATGILLIGTLIGFGINLKDFSEIAVSSFYFYAQSGKWFFAGAFWFIFAGIAFIFSYVLFRFGFILVNFATPENEKAELGKNNIILAGIHAVIYIMLCYILSASVTLLANTFVGYSQMPN